MLSWRAVASVPATAVAATVALGLAGGCEDDRPAYFSVHPAYQDPAGMDKPSYYDKRPNYRYTDDPASPPSYRDGGS